MSYNHVYPRCCLYSSSDPDQSKDIGQFKLYQFFVFCIPILFTFALLFVFYLFYLRPRRRVNLSSLAIITILEEDNNDFATVELGLRKEFREMLPIVVYKESFSVRDTLCSVCLSDYQAEDRLQQIPACGHTFHIDCIDSWLSIHSTCPLCRLSLLSSHKFQVKSPDVPGESSNESSAFPHSPQVCEETEDTLFPGTRNGEPETVEIRLKADAEVGSHCADCEGELRGVGNAAGVHEHTGGSSG